MTILPLLLFCSLVLVAASITLFVWSARQGDCHQSERMCLLPLDDDTGAPPRDQAAAPRCDGVQPASIDSEDREPPCP